MGRHQTIIYKAISYLLLFILGFVTASAWQGLRSSIYFRPVQHLVSSDRAHLAVLERSDAFLDLNFRIVLNGQKIYHSPDFRPNSSIPFRETLLWDTTGKRLLLEVTGRRLFGYHVSQQRALSAPELLQVKVATPTDMAIGFEGQWPDAK
jgi:hypothetical protein